MHFRLFVAALSFLIAVDSSPAALADSQEGAVYIAVTKHREIGFFNSFGTSTVFSRPVVLSTPEDSEQVPGLEIRAGSPLQTMGNGSLWLTREVTTCRFLQWILTPTP